MGWRALLSRETSSRKRVNEREVEPMSTSPPLAGSVGMNGNAAPAPAATPVLELVGLTAGYGDLAAIRDLSLHVCPGEIVALFGSNGAGKTTTLLASIGSLPKMRGEVRW